MHDTFLSWLSRCENDRDGKPVAWVGNEVLKLRDLPHAEASGCRCSGQTESNAGVVRSPQLKSTTTFCITTCTCLIARSGNSIFQRVEYPPTDIAPPCDEARRAQLEDRISPEADFADDRSEPGLCSRNSNFRLRLQHLQVFGSRMTWSIAS